MRVYKFLSREIGEKVICEKRLRVTPFNKLNDPFDLFAVRWPSAHHRLTWKKSLFDMTENRGMLCFSSMWANPVVWSHYADSHQGVALGFDIPDAQERLSVEYSKDLIDGTNYPSMQKAEKLQFMFRLFSTKYSDWRYENEIRYFMDLDPAEKENGHYYYDFGSSLKLKEIILGCQFVGDAKSIRRSLGEQKVKIVTSRAAFETFSVVVQKSKTLQK